MNAYEKMIQAELESIQVNPGAGLKTRILSDAASGDITPAKDKRRRIGMRIALIAAIIAVMAVTTAAAASYINGRRNVALWGVGYIHSDVMYFGESRVVQRPDRSDMAGWQMRGGWQMTTRNFDPEVYGHSAMPPQMMRMSYSKDFFSVADANLYIETYKNPFTIKEPSFLPPNVELNVIRTYFTVGGSVWLSRIEYVIFELRRDPYEEMRRAELLARIRQYNLSVFVEDVFLGDIVLCQMPVGRDAVLDVTVNYPAKAEIIMIGDIEAVLISEQRTAADRFWGDLPGSQDGYFNAVIIWLADGIRYNLRINTIPEAYMNLRTLIAIAESIG